MPTVIKNGVAIINPKNGAIEAVIDFKDLNKVTNHPGLDVLNGMAYDTNQNVVCHRKTLG